jgi:2'-5' RNA ligase
MTVPARASSRSGSSRSGSSRSGSSRSGSSRSGSSRSGSSRSGSSAAVASASSRAAEPASSAADSPARALRLFVALELPEAARAVLAAFRDEVDTEVWRPVADEALHLTLAFLGRRPAGDVTIVSSVLQEAGEAAPRLALAGALLLPPRRARVLCAALEDPDGALAALQARVSDELTAAGVYTPEKRPFRAHATVARIRPRTRAPRTIDTAPEPLEFAGGPLTLFESRLHPHGARYEPLVRVNLH